MPRDLMQAPTLGQMRFDIGQHGVHGVVGEAEIKEALSFGDPAGAGQSLASLCNARGSPDNFTLIVVDCA